MMKRFRVEIEIAHAGQNYAGVIALLKELNATRDGGSDSWLVDYAGTAADLDQRFQLLLGVNDRIEVIEI